MKPLVSQIFQIENFILFKKACPNYGNRLSQLSWSGYGSYIKKSCWNYIKKNCLHQHDERKLSEGTKD